METREVDYKNFGKCLEIKEGNTKILVTIEVGPRIIYYGTKTSNIFFEDIDRMIKKSGQYFDKNFKPGEKWYIYGGHRLWKSPEDDASYVPDNYPINYIVYKEDDSVEFFGNLQKNTNFVFKIKIKVLLDKIKVINSIENKGKNTASVAVWGITVLDAGGVEIIPLTTIDTGYLPNNCFVWWPYNDFNDSRLFYKNDYMFLRQDKQIERPFKIGLLSKKGIAGYLNKDILFIKKFLYIDGAKYPDYGVNFETYENNYFLEMESLSPVYQIEPGEEVLHLEEYKFYENVTNLDDAISITEKEDKKGEFDVL